MPIQFQCIQCKHFWGAGKCAAFPDGIPEEIWRGDFNHEEPYPKDNGIQFEPKEQSRAKGSAGKLGG